MTATIASLFDAFQSINAGVKGVKFAPNSTQTPSQLIVGQLPAAITWYADDDWTKFGNTTFVVEVYVAPIGNANPTLAMQNCLALAQAFRATYRALRQVGGIDIVREKGGHGFGSNGVHKTMGYAGQNFFGFSFRVPLMDVL